MINKTDQAEPHKEAVVLVELAKTIGICLITNAEGLIDLGQFPPDDLIRFKAVTEKAGIVIAGQGKDRI